MKIAVYARYSNEIQNPKSTADQIRECRAYIQKKFRKCHEIIVFSDSALSGQFSHNRDGYQALLTAIRARAVDVLVAEGLDRINRDSTENTMLFRMCQFKRIPIYTIQEGRVDKLKSVIKGVMNEMYIDSLATQVKRAHRSRAEEGKIFGRSYGYKIKIANGREVKGDRVIAPEEAKVVREIYTMYADGHSLGSIVEYLNAKGIPSPSGGQWTKNSLSGSIKRNDGILHKPIYRGLVIWNLTSLNINPETNGINYTINDLDDQVHFQREDLRLVSDELWRQCQQRRLEMHQRKKTYKKRLINPLHGIALCGVCHGKKTLANSARYVCSNYRRYRTCKNARGTRREAILEQAFENIRHDFDTHKDDFASMLYVEIAPQKKQELAELNELSQKLTEMITAKNLASVDNLTTRLAEIQRQRHALLSEIDAAQQLTGETHTEVINRALIDLHKNLLEPQYNDTYHVQLKALIKIISLVPTSGRYGEDITVTLQPDRWQVFFNLIKT